MKNDTIKRYICGEDMLVFVVPVREVCEKIAEAQSITQNCDYVTLAFAVAFTAALSAEQKEADTYVTASFRRNAKGSYVSVTAFGDGRICACTGEFEPRTGADGIILEVTRHSDVGGDYSSIVVGKNAQGAVNAYINESMQRSAHWKVIRDGKTSVGIFAQALPGSTGIRKCWDAIKPFFVSLDEQHLERAGLEALGESELTFGCHCTKRSAQRIIEALTPAERSSLGDKAEVVCRFCGRKYEVENG